ncbi:MAG: hypothetical protein ACKVKS_04430 [Candidatus Poseidoniales archaeon]
MTPLEKISSHYTHEERAMQWLDQICTEQDWVTIESTEIIQKGSAPDSVQFDIEIQGDSTRGYRLSGMVALGRHGLVAIQPLIVLGATEITTELLGNDPWCLLCISPEMDESQLPLGDRLCSMILALHDDHTLAKSMPLLDLFLAHDYEEHQWIRGYQSTGIALVEGDDEFYDSVPNELRHLDHHFSCLEDELQYAAYSPKDKQIVFDDEMREAAEETRQKKQMLE